MRTRAIGWRHRILRSGKEVGISAHFAQSYATMAVVESYYDARRTGNGVLCGGSSNERA
jgi:hypothetical protein